MSQLELSKKLATTFPGFIYSREKHNYNKRNMRKDLLDIPFIYIYIYITGETLFYFDLNRLNRTYKYK